MFVTPSPLGHAPTARALATFKQTIAQPKALAVAIQAEAILRA